MRGDDLDPCDDPRDDAAAWFAHLLSGKPTPEDRRRFERWKNAHPEHELQFRNMQRIWQASRYLPRDELRAALNMREPVARKAGMTRRRFGIALAGACTASLAGGIAVHRLWLDSPLQTIPIVSARGERRQVALPDGSMLDVNTDTRAMARMYAEKHVVELLEGEIFFAVQRDPARKFIVEAGHGRIDVTGTRFNVRRDGQQVHVSVESGAVDVSSGAWWRRRSRTVVRGRGVIASAGQALSEVHKVELGRVLAWQRGKIVFENTPLEQAIAEINRYLAQPARLDAPALRGYRIAGIVSIEDPQALIDTLPEFAPVRVIRLPDGRSRIVPI
ncbi:MAG: FecR domain-containing protein [Candidimonas sp.]